MAASEIENPGWEWDVTRASQDKRASRTGVPPKGTFELIGVDGNEEGGCRVFPGFELLQSLTGDLDDEMGSGEPLAETGDAVGPSVIGTQALAGAYPFTCWRGNTSTIYGFIYRVTDESGNSRVFIEFGQVGDSSWYGPMDVTGWLTSGDQPMTVEVVGRNVYVGIAGDQPHRIYFAEGGSVEDSIRVVEDTGPGSQPTLTIATETGLSAVQDLDTINDPVPVPAGQDPPAAARIIFFGFSGKTMVRQHSDLRGDSASDYTASGTGMIGPQDIWLWGSQNETGAPQVNPTFQSRYEIYPNGDVRELIEGSRYDMAARTLGDPVGLPLAPYSFSYRLYDTRTGTYSALSNVLDTAPNPDVATNASVGGSRRTTVFRSANTADDVGSGETATFTNRGGYLFSSFFDVTFPAIDVTYDADKYDTLLVYRSMAAHGEAVTATQYRLQSLEAEITLADYTVDAEDLPSAYPTWSRAIYFFTLTDGELAGQQSLGLEFEYKADMPSAGALKLYKGVMLMGNFNLPESNDGYMPVVRWSSPYEISPELVSPFNRDLLETRDEEILDFICIGPNAFGFSDRQQYMIRREGVAIRVYPQHGGFGLTSPHGVTRVGSYGYWCTSFGIKRMDAVGALDDVEVFDYMIRTEWAGNLSNINLVYDEKISALFVHNPDLERAGVLWMNKQRTTELHDMTFSFAAEGEVATQYGVTTPSFDKRAVFFQFTPIRTGGYETRAYVVDADRSKAYTRMLDVTNVGDSECRFSQVSVTATGGTEPTTIVVNGASTEAAPTLTNPEGSYLYVLTGTERGKKARVKWQNANQSIELEEGNEIIAANLVADDVLSLSPVYFRWAGGIAGLSIDPRNPDFQKQEFFRRRRMTSISASFTGVTDEIGDSSIVRHQSFSGLVFEGHQTTPSYRGFAQPPNRSAAVAQSIQEGPCPIAAGLGTDEHGVEGALLAPGIEVTVSDLDFTLLGVRVDGTIGGESYDTRPEALN